MVLRYRFHECVWLHSLQGGLPEFLAHTSHIALFHKMRFKNLKIFWQECSSDCLYLHSNCCYPPSFEQRAQENNARFRVLFLKGFSLNRIRRHSFLRDKATRRLFGPLCVKDLVLRDGSRNQTKVSCLLTTWHFRLLKGAGPSGDLRPVQARGLQHLSVYGKNSR